MQELLASDVSNWPAENAQLIGSRCDDCAAATWPRQELCPRCGKKTMADRLFPRQGTLVAWTTQGFVPGPPFVGADTPDDFEPFAVGLIQLGDEIRVEARLTESDPEKLRFGMDVELVFVPFHTNGEGKEVLIWAFQPV
jgi:uncharacterized OB-fold protein